MYSDKSYCPKQAIKQRLELYIKQMVTYNHDYFSKYFEELPIEKFIEQLKSELQEANYDTRKLKYDQLKDGTYNFSYNEFQIGRIKFGKRSSSMQILTKDFVSWLKNETMEIYLSNIKQWIEYIKEVEAERKKYNL